MSATPTPEEARQTLEGYDQQRKDSATASGYSTGYWIGAGVVVAAFGVFTDFYPTWAGAGSTWFSLVLLAVVVLASTRWGSALVGRRVQVRRPPTGRRWLLALLGAALGLVAMLALAGLDLPHSSAVVGIVFGLLLAVGGPWWQRRTLAREATRL
ncbi:hypothetical protein [Actinoplanes sp. NBRC 101535]|uniref:hypothetical protein n=1 Tax=Actinoplanes sp. NBRC 101535 TaxID=3032196 RepID=UPI0024A4AF0F|nr:hypothetical protein [Actinoplanes sp. NBRC 101535]GLY08574.1 hypothetical protein Acsp01_89530 [Actinoplanes sp. NBRC 101535]